MQASARVVETVDVPTTGAATVGAGLPDAPPRHGRRMSRRAIEIVGIVLGIAIVAAVARAHGGRLLSAPSEGGARLVLELPLAAAAAGAAGAAAAPAPAQRR